MIKMMLLALFSATVSFTHGDGKAVQPAGLSPDTMNVIESSITELMACGLADGQFSLQHDVESQTTIATIFDDVLIEDQLFPCLANLQTVTAVQFESDEATSQFSKFRHTFSHSDSFENATNETTELPEFGIYAITAPTPIIEEFVSLMKAWEGGYHFLTETSETNSTASFAAYPERTASQSRQFIFTAMSYGLEVEIETFDEAKYYPGLRETIDQFASDCGVDPSIARITPGPSLQFGGSAIQDANDEDVDCFLMKTKSLHNLLGETGFIGNAPEEESN